MPGGDICAYYPARMLASILSTVMTDNEIEKLFKYNYARHLRHGLNELDTLLKQSKDPHTMTTSSLGRLLDATAVALNVCTIRTYESEPPMRLEAAARDGIPGKIKLELKVTKQNNKYIFDTSDFILSLMNAIKDNKTPDIAYEVHRAIGKALGEVACMLSDQYKIANIGLTGGSAVNSYLFKHIKEEIERNNKKLLFHTNYPSGDGCISLGQAVVASTHPLM